MVSRNGGGTRSDTRQVREVPPERPINGLDLNIRGNRGFYHFRDSIPRLDGTLSKTPALAGTVTVIASLKHVLAHGPEMNSCLPGTWRLNSFLHSGDAP